MRADRMLALLPAMSTILLLMFMLAPIDLGGLSLAPHAVWCMALGVGATCPPCWPLLAAFLLGLLSDFLLGTPLGAQALITLLVSWWVQQQHGRRGQWPFLLRWAEAAGLLVLAHVALWVLIGVAAVPRPPFTGLMGAAAISALWYPLFYGFAMLIQRAMPGRG